MCCLGLVEFATVFAFTMLGILIVFLPSQVLHAVHAVSHINMTPPYIITLPCNAANVDIESLVLAWPYSMQTMLLVFFSQRCDYNSIQYTDV